MIWGFMVKDIITPNLDLLAKEGVRFTNFYVTAVASTPSRGSLLTGRYPQRNGTYELFRNNRVNDRHIYTAYEYSTSPEYILGMDNREVLLPELLKKKGYYNGIFGKWDLGQLYRFLPLQRGFDEYYGFSNTGIDYYTHERYFVPSMFRNNEKTEVDKGIYSTHLFEREALRFIKENKNNPFFLYLPFNAPHSASNWEVKEIQAPQEYIEMYPDSISFGKRAYMAAVTCMDSAIGSVLNLVDSLNLTSNTIVVFLSDNGGGGGGADNSPLRGGKATMWEGGLRVPCIIKWPGKIKKGEIIDNFVSSLEMFPTILDIVNVKTPDSLIIDGFSILPLLTGKNNNLEREEMYWEFREERAARIGHWKWLESERRDSHKGLYNLSSDIREQNDLSGQEEIQHQLIRNKFLHWQNEMAKAEPRGPFKNF